jgi:hypothetical protein
MYIDGNLGTGGAEGEVMNILLSGWDMTRECRARGLAVVILGISGEESDAETHLSTKLVRSKLSAASNVLIVMRLEGSAWSVPVANGAGRTICI